MDRRGENGFEKIEKYTEDLILGHSLSDLFRESGRITPEIRTWLIRTAINTSEIIDRGSYPVQHD